MKSILKWVPAAAACALLAACATGPATKPTTGVSAEAAVTQRAEARWNELIAHKAAQAWDYLTPGYRKTITRQDYADAMNGRPLKWKKVKVDRVKCATPDRCTAYVMVTYDLRLPRMGGGTAFAPLVEDWLRLGGQWYYLPRETGGNPFKATH